MNYSDEQLTKNNFLGNKLEILQFSEGYRGNMDSVLVAASVAAESGQKVLELGCGKGEYSLALAKLNPEINYIGIDIKGARFWKGAKDAIKNKLDNVIFLRTQIELIENIFDKNEVSEIWITFPDPQIKFKREKHRLVNLKFIDIYREILLKGGVVNLKTDSEFLHGYMLGLISGNDFLELTYSNNDIYNQSGSPTYVTEIKTFYELKFLDENKAITFISFRIN